MASDTAAIDRKRELSREIERARRGLTTNSRSARRDLNVGSHARAGFKRNRTVWLSGAAVLGWLISKLPPRTKKVKVLVDRRDQTKIKEVKEAGIMMVIVKLIIGLVKPLIMAYMTKKIADLGQSSEKAVEQTEKVVQSTEKVAAAAKEA